jgi:EmrB/QacA subfamily drug resistance transporter
MERDGERGRERRTGGGGERGQERRKGGGGERGHEPGTGGGGERGVRRGWWPLAVIAAAHLMAVLDTTVMFVALPSVQRGLGLTVAGRQWVITSYTLALAGLLLLGGRLADRFGARNTLLVGVIGFACASAVGGAAVDGAMLITARAVQGAFGAVLVSSTKSLLVNVYPDGRERARAIGIFTATLTAGLAVGLILGGVLTSALSWRWCLYVNIPLSLVAVLGAPRVLPALPGRREIRIDVTSAVLACAGMAGLIYGLGEAAAAGWGSAQVTGSLIAAVVLLGWFVARQAGRPDRLLPLRVVLDRNRGWGMIALIVNAVSTFGMLLILTYQLQSVMGYSALDTGLAIVPFGVATGIGAALLAPWLMSRVPPRWLVSASIVIEAAGLVPLIWLTPSSRYLPLILAALLVEGLGTGIAGPTALNLALRGVLPSDAGAAGAATSAVGQLGSSVGAALLNTIAAAATSGYLAAHTGAGPVTAIVHGFAVAMAWGAGLLVLAALPVAVFITATAPARRRSAT